jgi:hypothetical protein
MKTTNIVLIGVVGIGAVGAYMYMKNKKAQDNVLSGSLPATPTSTTPSTTPTETTPLIPTPNLTEPVKISSDANLDAFNLQTTLDQLKKLNARYNSKEPSKKLWGQRNKEWDSWNYFRKVTYKKQKETLVAKLSSLGYKYDNGLLVKI